MQSFRQTSIAIAALCSVLTCSAQAAEVDPDELSRLAAQARTDGLVPVVVHLGDASLDDIRRNGGATKVRFNRQADQLTGELGSHALQSGSWSNGLGQVELYVTEQGLALLQGSGSAKSFRAGKPWTARTMMSGADGRFDAIERALATNGYVDVEVLPNVDGLEYRLSPDGAIAIDPASREAVFARAGALLSALDSRHASDLSRAQSQLTASRALASLGEAVLTLRLTREGVIKLATSDLVRSMRPVGFQDRRPQQIDTEIKAVAQRDGRAEVMLTLRTPIFGGHLSQASLRAQTRAQATALREVLAAAGIDHTKWRSMAMFGAMSGWLTPAQLDALTQRADARVLVVERVKPVATMSLATSTAMVNAPAAWAKGYRAAGQNIVVLDNGTQASHAFLRNASGQSRVVFETCFGTNGVSNGITYRSACPSADANGDGPLGQPGSAAPVAGCWTGHELTCSHGTHVAGITAGRNGAAVPSGLQGLAPDASIVAVQVFSFDRERNQQPMVFNSDLVAAMEEATNAMGQPAPNNPFTLNLSLGGGRYTGPCGANEQAFWNAVLLLKSVGAPVIAATGNDNFLGAVAWPACVPGVVQVSSVNNDGVGAARSIFSTANGVTLGANLARPSQFTADYIWLAPGGGGGTSVNSAIVSAPGYASYRGMQGTSQAAPHVAGIYALVKAGSPGVTVDGVSEWLREVASVSVAIPMCAQPPCAPADTVTFRRVRLPNL